MTTNGWSQEEIRTYDRQMFRSSLVSLFWSVIAERKRSPQGFKLQQLADALGKSKSVVSRWFSPQLPNWGADTVADIAGALNLDIEIVAIDRTTRQRFTSSGAVNRVVGVGTASSAQSTSGPASHSRRLQKDVYLLEEAA